MISFARLAFAASLLLVSSLSQALTVVPYTPAALAAAQKAGEPVVLHFHASWCPTCRAQDKAFDALKADPSLKLTLMEVDYDQEKALEKQLHVTAQSTLIVLHGAAERSRSTGETDPARLKSTLQGAL
ncbi:MAG: thioredoxin family protein [Vitreoscilla sp.]